MSLGQVGNDDETAEATILRHLPPLAPRAALGLAPLGGATTCRLLGSWLERPLKRRAQLLHDPHIVARVQPLEELDVVHSIV